MTGPLMGYTEEGGEGTVTKQTPPTRVAQGLSMDL